MADATSTPEPSETHCTSCGATSGLEAFVITCDWLSYLCERRSVGLHQLCYEMPLCPECYQHADDLERREMRRRSLPPEKQRAILDDRNDFLDSLDPQLITEHHPTS